MANTRHVALLHRLGGRLRWIHVAPLLAVLTLGAWAFASPVGAAPDDDYHLASTWCALGGSDSCTPVEDPNLRELSTAFAAASCYAQVAERSAACQDTLGLDLNGSTKVTDRGNFHGKYPPVYYGAMRVLAGDDLVASALLMRVVNAVLFVGLATALAVLMPGSRRQTLLWGWLISLVPLGVFLIPSNNPSGWAITGVGTAFMALLGWFEAQGKRRWALGALYVVGIVMAAGARGDAAMYAAGATLVAALLTWSREREWLWRAALPAAGLVIIALLYMTAAQSDVGTQGIPGGVPSTVTASPLGLAVQNLLTMPLLVTGVWGTWALGWFDTQMPAVVPWAAVGAFIAVAFAGVGLLTKRKAFALSGVFAVMIGLPVYVLTIGGDTVGSNFQPRYILPLIVLFSLVLVTAPPGSRGVIFTRAQTTAILGALVIANTVALQVNIRRYVTGADQQGFNLGAGAEWWWDGFALGPLGVWVIGSASFACLLAVLWPELRRVTTAPGGALPGIETTAGIEAQTSAEAASSRT